VCVCVSVLKLKLKTNLYSAIKSEDSKALDGGTSRLSSQREYGEIRLCMFCVLLLPMFGEIK